MSKCQVITFCTLLSTIQIVAVTKISNEPFKNFNGKP